MELNIMVYTKDKFKYEVMDYFIKNENFKDFINNIYDDKIGSKLKKRLIKRINLCKSEEEWWLLEETNNTNDLLHLWNISNDIKEYAIYQNGVENYAHEQLENVREQVESGKITEQEYIDKCNWIKYRKEEDENLMDAYKRKVIGNMHKNEDLDKVALHIICLPSVWNKNSSVINF